MDSSNNNMEVFDDGAAQSPSVSESPVVPSNQNVQNSLNVGNDVMPTQTPVEVSIQAPVPTDTVGNNIQVTSSNNQVASEPVIKTDTPVAPATSINETVSENKPKRKNIVPVIILLLAVFIGVYYFIIMSPKRIVTKVINYAYGNYADFNDKYINNKEYNSINYSGNITIDSKYEEAEQLNAMKINYSVGLDRKNEKISLNTSVNSDDEETLSLLYFLKESISYIDVKNLTPKMIKIDTKEYASKIFEVLNENSDNSDYNYLIKSAKDSIIDAVSEDKLTKSIAYNESGLVSIRTIYQISEAEISKIYKTVMTNYSNDEKSLEIFKNILKSDSTAEVKEYFQESISYIDEENLSSEETSRITMYNNAFTGQLSKIIIESEESNLTCNTSKKSINCDLKMSEDENVSIVYDGKLGTLDLKINYDTFLVTMNNEYKKESDSITNIVSTIKVTPDTENDKVYVQANINSKIELNAEIKDIDTTGAVFYSELSEEELDSISENMGLLFSSLLSSTSSGLVNTTDSKEEVFKDAIRLDIKTTEQNWVLSNSTLKSSKECKNDPDTSYHYIEINSMGQITSVYVVDANYAFKLINIIDDDYVDYLDDIISKKDSPDIYNSILEETKELSCN